MENGLEAIIMNEYASRDDAVNFPQYMSVTPYVYLQYKLNPLITYDQVAYHYTDINGFKGLIENRCFWASNILFMNDRTEFVEGLKICNEVIDKLEKSESRPILRRYYSELRKSVNANAYRGLGISWSAKDIFAISFCKNGNLLSQWRGYGKNGGISIGFDINTLVNCALIDEAVIEEANNNQRELNANDAGRRVFLNKVVYDEKKKNRILKDIVMIGRDFILRKKIDDNDFLLSSAVSGVTESIFPIIPLLKDKGFNEEQECRFISHFPADGATKVCFRERNNILLPYLKLHLRDCNSKVLANIPVVDIIVGPRKDQDFAIENIKYFLFHTGNEYLVDKVRKSDIPYRE